MPLKLPEVRDVESMTGGVLGANECASEVQPLSAQTIAPIFVLAPPRSFSTVIAAMLGQHPQLYGLPELHLFSARNIDAWLGMCKLATFDMDHGLLRVAAELFFGDQTESAVTRAAGWLRRRSHWSTALVLEEIAKTVSPRVLVEKSPSIVYRLDHLKRSLDLFPSGRFIHLVRHPRGHGESVMKYLEARRKLGPLLPSHWLIQLASFPSLSSENPDTNQARRELDPQRSWYALNLNICEFLEWVPDGQKLVIRGEDVMADPDKELTQIVRWLGLRDDAEAIGAMKHPEKSPYSSYGPPRARYGSDRNFMADPHFRQRTAEKMEFDGPLSWRKDCGTLLPEVRGLAQKLGYA
jgi:Sulfotransferase family